MKGYNLHMFEKRNLAIKLYLTSCLGGSLKFLKLTNYLGVCIICVLLASNYAYIGADKLMLPIMVHIYEKEYFCQEYR